MKIRVHACQMGHINRSLFFTLLTFPFHVTSLLSPTHAFFRRAMIGAGAPAQIWAGRCPIVRFALLRPSDPGPSPSSLLSKRVIWKQKEIPCVRRLPRSSPLQPTLAGDPKPPMPAVLPLLLAGHPCRPRSSPVGDCNSPTGLFQLAPIVVASSPRITASARRRRPLRPSCSLPMQQKILSVPTIFLASSSKNELDAVRFQHLPKVVAAFLPSGSSNKNL